MTPNPVYTQVISALRGVVSERAAETMLSSALADLRLSASSVTAPQMQQVLSGPLLRRLSVVLPAFQARDELRALARHVAVAHPKAPTLFMDPQGPLDWNSAQTIHPFGAASGPTAALQAGADPVSPFQAAPRDEALLDVGDFEFDDPDYSAFAGGSRVYNLGRPEEQEALLSALARLPEVQGAVLCSRDGRLLRARAQQAAPQLSSVVAATALLFQKRALGLLCADLGRVKVCMRPLGDYCVAVLAGEHVNIGRLMNELKQLQDAA